MIDEYFTDLESRIEAGTGLAGKVYDTVRLDATGGVIRDNYVILYSPVALDIPQTRFTEIPTFASDVEFESDLKVVGISGQAVRQMLARVMTQLIGYKTTITGRQPARISLGSQGRVREDTSVKPFLYFAEASIEWTSRPA